MRKLIIEVPIEVHDTEYEVEQTLLDSAAFFFEAAIRHEQAREGKSPWTADSDVTVWTEEGYAEDHPPKQKDELE